MKLRKLEAVIHNDRLRVEVIYRACPVARPCVDYIVGTAPQECQYLKPDGKTPECTLRGE